METTQAAQHHWVCCWVCIEKPIGLPHPPVLEELLPPEVDEVLELELVLEPEELLPSLDELLLPFELDEGLPLLEA